ILVPVAVRLTVTSKVSPGLTVLVFIVRSPTTPAIAGDARTATQASVINNIKESFLIDFFTPFICTPTSTGL
ncbi:MAG: hypothetical protein PWQ75_1985, partial [Methanolobus sp.]|nr:hypothetical protein [Methanolobus sp.]